MGRPEVDAVLDAIYDAATEPQLWRNALEKIGDRFGGAPIITGLQPIPHPAIFAVSCRLDEDLLGLFAERYSTPDTNPSIPHLITHPAGEPFDSVLEYGRTKYFRLDLYKDLYEPQKLWLRCTASLFKTPQMIAPFGLMGRPGCEMLTSQEIDELRFLFPHMARAMRVTGRIVRNTRENHAMHSMFDQLEVAAILVAADGKIIFMNQSAEQITCAGDGIRTAAGRLKAENSNENLKLERLIAAACSRAKRGGGSMGIDRPSGAPRYGVEVTSLSTDSVFAVGAAVFINDPTRAARSSTDQLAAIFGLTSAEARIAAKIVEGLSLTDASDQLNTSLNTAKTLLQRVFAKTGARRQSELVRMIVSTIPDIDRS